MTGLAERLKLPESVPYPGKHLGLRWRSIMAADAPAVFDLIRTVEAADDSIRRTGADAVAEMIEGRGGVDWVDAIVGVDVDRKICAVGTVRVVRTVTDTANALINAYVHPHWRGRGLGRALLYWQDGRARQMLVETFGGDSQIPASIANFVDGHKTDRRRLYIAAGFYAKRTFQIMYRDLEGSEQPAPTHHGYTIRPFVDVSEAAVRDLHMRVFQEHFRPDFRGQWWKEGLREMDARWSFVACDPDGTAVGYIMTGRPTDRWVATGRTEAYVALLGVDPAHRGYSLSSALVDASVAAAAASGMSRIGLDVDTKNDSNAHGIYEHLGFVDEKAEVYYTIDL
ncbi:GNAT family N-acetyltransferase [Schaalia vaccimaxillae]|uniref:GNAT family N-acetyltransferase n=1 Tax=Schaalia vaccimaxillae TaxID=183916 RepID=UPI000590CFC1|nr:GNAT family N-acetyltransferase [Schaalia vaccimaxillae]